MQEVRAAFYNSGKWEGF